MLARARGRPFPSSSTFMATSIQAGRVPEAQAAPGYAGKALLASTLGYAMDGFDFLILGFMLNAIKADLGLGQTEVASLATWTLVGAVVGGIVFGMLSDRFGRVRILSWTILVFAVFTMLTGIDQGHGFVYETFHALLHGLDPGTIGGDAGSWQFLLTMLVLTLAGLFIVSALIGVISAGIDERVADLRRGRSVVVERDHTVILGWSDAVFTIVRELSIANESRRRAAVVILAEKDKPEMEDELRQKVPSLRGTRVVCRTGSPMDLDDLALTAHHAARSVIVLAPDVDEPDTEVIKTVLALTQDGGGAPIVAEIGSPENLEAATLVGRGRAVLLDRRETVARLIVQTSRQSGAAAVFTELFDFDGSEIYFATEHGLPPETTYAEAQLAFEDAVVIGVLDADGSATLNPEPGLALAGRTLVVVAEDDSAIERPAVGRCATDPAAISDRSGEPDRPTRALLVGWNDRAPTIVRELDNYAPAGSRLTVLTEYGDPALPPLRNLVAEVVHRPSTQRSTLAAYVGADLDQAMVLCYSDHLPTQQADARTLVTLLHLRELLGDGPAIVSEMLDDRNRKLAEIAHVDDVIVSDELLSLMLSQLSENPALEPVFAVLLDADGSEIYLRPVEWYLERGATFATVVEAASRKGECAIGYRFAGAEGAAGGVVVNPSKSTAVPAAPGDKVIVLAR